MNKSPLKLLLPMFILSLVVYMLPVGLFGFNAFGADDIELLNNEPVVSIQEYEEVVSPDTVEDDTPETDETDDPTGETEPDTDIDTDTDTDTETDTTPALDFDFDEAEDPSEAPLTEEPTAPAEDPLTESQAGVLAQRLLSGGSGEPETFFDCDFDGATEQVTYIKSSIAITATVGRTTFRDETYLLMKADVTTFDQLKTLLEQTTYYETVSPNIPFTDHDKIIANITMTGDMSFDDPITPICGIVLMDGAKPSGDKKARSGTLDTVGHSRLVNCYTLTQKDTGDEAFETGNSSSSKFHTIMFRNMNFTWRNYYGVVSSHARTNTIPYAINIDANNIYFLGPQFAHNWHNTTMTLRDSQLSIMKTDGKEANSAMEVSRLYIDGDVSIKKPAGEDAGLNFGLLGMQCNTGPSFQSLNYPPGYFKAPISGGENLDAEDSATLRGLFVSDGSTLFAENKSTGGQARVFSDEAGTSVDNFDIIVGDGATVTLKAPKGITKATVDHLDIGQGANVLMATDKDYAQYGFGGLGDVVVDNGATWHFHNNNGEEPLLTKKDVAIGSITVRENCYVTLDRGKSGEEALLNGMLTVGEGSIFTATGADYYDYNSATTDTSVCSFFALARNSSDCGVQVDNARAFYLKGYIRLPGAYTNNTLTFKGVQFDAWKLTNTNQQYSDSAYADSINAYMDENNTDNYYIIDYNNASDPNRHLLPIYVNNGTTVAKRKLDANSTTHVRQFAMSDVRVSVNTPNTKSSALGGNATTVATAVTEIAAKYVPRGSTPTASTAILDEKLTSDGGRAVMTEWVETNSHGNYSIPLATHHDGGDGWSYSDHFGYSPLVKNREIAVYARVNIFPGVNLYVNAYVLTTPNASDETGLISTSPLNFGSDNDLLLKNRIPLQNAGDVLILLEDGRNAIPGNTWTLSAQATQFQGTYLEETVKLHPDALQYKTGASTYQPLSSAVAVSTESTDGIHDICSVTFDSQDLVVDPSRSVVAPVNYQCEVTWSVTYDAVP